MLLAKTAVDASDQQTRQREREILFIAARSTHMTTTTKRLIKRMELIRFVKPRIVILVVDVEPSLISSHYPL